MTWDRESNEEYDDGHTRDSFERAEEDTGDEPEDESEAELICPVCNSLVCEPDQAFFNEKAAHEDVTLAIQRIKAYNRRLNELEISPNGDDYNNLLDILSGLDRMPHTSDR